MEGEAGEGEVSIDSTFTQACRSQRCLIDDCDSNDHINWNKHHLKEIKIYNLYVQQIECKTLMSLNISKVYTFRVSYNHNI